MADLYDEATVYANKKVKQKQKENPCMFCEQIDCEGCEYFK